MSEEPSANISQEQTNKPWQFQPGISGNPNGRPPETIEQKAIKKAIKEFVSDYKEKLAEALPKIEPILVNKAIAGDIQAIKELHDRVMGKPPQDLNLGGEVSLPFTIIIEKDEKREKS